MDNPSKSYDAIVKILKNKESDCLSRLKAHLIRILMITYGISWKTEINRDLSRLINFTREPFLYTDDDIGSAIKSLESDAIIKTEYHKRGDWPTPGEYVDQLISLINKQTVARVLSNDLVYTQYISYRQKIIKESLNNKKENRKNLFMS